jgi:hypothetical protein
MRQRNAAWTVCALALMLGIGPGLAQTSVPSATEDALHEMSQRAAIIFSGQVVAIRRHQGVVEIDFAVNDAIRGVSGEAYTLREWSGLWSAGDEPLRLGQRYLMLLHAPGSAGLSSPVGGADGAIPIFGGAGSAEGLPQPAAIAGPAPSDGRVVDLRWVAAQAVRIVPLGADPTAHPTSLPVALRAETREAQINVAAAQSREAAATSAAYASVLGLLRTWEKEKTTDAAR